MTFEKFKELTNRNFFAVLMAVDLIMQNGRAYVQNTEDAEMIAALKGDVKNLVADTMLDEVVSTAKEMASIKTYTLLGYFKRSDFDFRQPDEPEHNICPICGCTVEYQTSVVFEDSGYYEWYCSGCGATGKEGYNKVFIQHYDVRDDKGNPFPPPTK